ncbi:hypothetical protein DUNSADRAFT_10332 [Dunaliella salina]|uniref:Uncharacterized protein n=1 Tax=Dunaliella salina TaxID=3046 RepID=A0ABQ7H4V9_DUNSA|nr:hypothetical protein DUNSADRAFT_10332 [Dunaliella salina]|eukprot:KAF5841895.1 hypothetical protein DUNSADRAFT_10332 [Dunaliella salina]
MLACMQGFDAHRVALLALEQERNALADQLEAYSRIDLVHAQKMREVHEKHSEAMKDASGVAGRKLERLYESAAAAYAARCLAKHLARALAWWHFEAVRSRRLVWASRVWDNRKLEVAFLGWQQVWWEASQAKASACFRRLLHRASLQHTRRLLHAWQARVEHWQYKRGVVQRAEARYNRSLAKHAMAALTSQVGCKLRALQQLAAMGRVRKLRMTVRGWFAWCVLSKRAARMARRGRLQNALRQWSRAVCTAVVAAEQAELKFKATCQRLKVDSLGAWHNVTVLRAHRRWAASQIAMRARAAQLHAVLQHWYTELRVSRWAAAREQQMLRGALLAWDAWGKRRQRLSRLAGSAAACRLQGLLSAALGEWRVLGAGRRARLLGVDLTKMQVQHSDAHPLTTSTPTPGIPSAPTRASPNLQASPVAHREDLSTRVSCEPVALDTKLLPQGQLKAVRDGACCACGPSSFVAIGGFDGQKETMDMLVFKIKASRPPSAAPSLSATVELLQPRSIRSPIGRSHHTATYHAQSRSILVFGGYSSTAGGHLNELWVFSMDLREWIQPDITGDWPPARRGHVAAVSHDALYVHGGFNGSEHWGDVWCLDLRRWHWEQLSPQVQ